MTLVQQPPANIATGVTIDREAVLQALNLNPRDPKVQALVMVCQQYGLDPVLKHAVLISGNLYVTRDGLLAVAHRTGNLDGITVEEEGENADEWWAKVSVHVKGQKYPYTYRGRYPKSGNQKRYGPEMAVKCAEVMALRRAFGVTGIATVEEQWDAHDSAIDAREVLPPAADDPAPDAVVLGMILRRIEDAPDDERVAIKRQFVAQFGHPDHLRQSQVDDVNEWLDAVVAAPASPGGGEGGAAPVDPPVGSSESEEPAGVNGAVSSAEASPPERPELVGAGAAATPNGETGTGDTGGHAGDPAPTPDVPSFVRPADERVIDTTHPATLFHDAVGRALPYLPTTYTDSDLRHTICRAASDNATEDWRQLDGDSLEAAVELLTQVTEGTRVLRDTSVGLVCDIRGPVDGPFVPDPLGALRAAIAKVHGLGEAKTLKQARVLAGELGADAPGSFADISGPVLAATLAWVEAQS